MIILFDGFPITLFRRMPVGSRVQNKIIRRVVQKNPDFCQTFFQNRSKIKRLCRLESCKIGLVLSGQDPNLKRGSGGERAEREKRLVLRNNSCALLCLLTKNI